MKTYKMPNLGKFISVENYNGVVNQFKLVFEKGIVFQSYNSIIVIRKDDGQTYIGQDYDYSRTTGKYRNMFLGEDLKNTNARIENGKYKMLNI